MMIVSEILNTQTRTYKLTCCERLHLPNAASSENLRFWISFIYWSAVILLFAFWDIQHSHTLPMLLIVTLSVLAMPALAAADACGNVPYALGGEQISPPKSSSAKARTSTQDTTIDRDARHAMMIATHAIGI